MKSVFVSSTFKDMQAERDMLQMHVFPRVRRKLNKLGEDIAFLDLRWGVDTLDMSEDESGHLVLKVCIDAIDRCVPYVIVFLGERYGWIPDRHLIETINDQRIEKLYEDQMSVTNLEIKYGAFERAEHLDHVLFCLRDSAFLHEVEPEYVSIFESESSFHQEKMNELKKRIKSDASANVIHYACHWDKKNHQICGLEALEEQIVQFLTECIEKEIDVSAVSHPMEELKREMATIQNQHLIHYVPRRFEEYKLLDMINTSLGRSTFKIHYHVCASAGVGKSAFLSRMARICEEESVQTIVYYFKTGSNQSFEGFKRYLIYRLEEILNQPHDEILDLDKRLKSLDAQIGEDTHVVCFVDGADQAFPGKDEMYFSLNEICQKVLFVISSLKEFKIHCHQMETMTINELVENQVQKIVVSTARKHGKKVDEKTTQMICLKSSCRNPLYLSNLLQRLFMMSGKEFSEAQKMAEGIEGISRYMTKLIDALPDDLEEIVKTVIHEAIEQFELPQFKEIVRLIALSEKGLTENDLREIFELNGKQFNSLRFSQLVTYLYDVFSQNENGCWSFTHRLYYDAVLKAELTFYLDLLSRYALANSSYLQREGYVYLLKTQHPQAYLALNRHVDRYGLINVLKWLLEKENGMDFLSSIIACADADFSYEILSQIEGTESLLNQLISSGRCSVSNCMKHLERQFLQNKKNPGQLQRILSQMKQLSFNQEKELYLSVLIHEGRIHEYQRQNLQAKHWYMKAFEECLKMQMEGEQQLKLLHQISEDMMYVELADHYVMDPYLLIDKKLSELTFDVESDLNLIKINNQKFLSKGYQVQKYYNPNKMINHMQNAFLLARDRAKKTNAVDDVRLAVQISRDFADILRLEMQYWALNKGLEPAETLFKMTGKTKDQWLLADMNYRIAESYDSSYRSIRFDRAAAKKKDAHEVQLNNHLGKAAKHYSLAYEQFSQCAQADAEYAPWYNLKAMSVLAKQSALQIEGDQYLKSKNKLIQVMESPQFSELSKEIQCIALTALLKAMLVNRKFQFEDMYLEKKTDQEIFELCLKVSQKFHEVLTSDPNEKTKNSKRKWIAWHCYYRSLLMFELYQDQEAYINAAEALNHADAIADVHERNCFEALMFFVHILVKLHQGTIEKELVEKVLLHAQKYPWRNMDGLHDGNAMMYEELPHLLKLYNKQFVENAGKQLRKTRDHFSVRLKKWIEKLIFEQCIEFNQLDDALCFTGRNRFNEYPDYGHLFVQVLNHATEEMNQCVNKKSLDLYAHMVLTYSGIQYEDHACVLARTMWKQLNFESVISTYEAAKKRQKMSNLDQFVYDSSICLLKWLNDEPITSVLSKPEAEGTIQEKYLAETLYEFVNLLYLENKVEPLLRLNEILPEVHGVEINLIYLGVMDLIHRYGILKQCSKEQLFQLKKGLMHTMKTRREFAEKMPDLVWYAYEKSRIEKMKKLDYHRSLIKVQLQYAECLRECKEAKEAVPYYLNALDYFKRYDAGELSIEKIENQPLEFVLNGLSYTQEDMHDLKLIFSGLVSTLPSRNQDVPLNLFALPAIAVKLAQMDSQYIGLAERVIQNAKLGKLEEYDAFVEYYVFAIDHGFDMRNQFLDMLENTTCPLTRHEDEVKRVKWDDNQIRRLHQIYESCALRNMQRARDRIYYRTEKVIR